MSEFDDSSEQPKVPTASSRTTLPPEIYPAQLPDTPMVPTWLYVLFGFVLVIIIVLVLIAAVTIIRSSLGSPVPVTSTPSLSQATLTTSPTVISADMHFTIAGAH